MSKLNTLNNSAKCIDMIILYFSLFESFPFDKNRHPTCITISTAYNSKQEITNNSNSHWKVTLSLTVGWIIRFKWKSLLQNRITFSSTFSSKHARWMNKIYLEAKLYIYKIQSIYIQVIYVSTYITCGLIVRQMSICLGTMKQYINNY